MAGRSAPECAELWAGAPRAASPPLPCRIPILCRLGGGGIEGRGVYLSPPSSLSLKLMFSFPLPCTAFSVQCSIVYCRYKAWLAVFLTNDLPVVCSMYCAVHMYCTVYLSKAEVILHSSLQNNVYIVIVCAEHFAAIGLGSMSSKYCISLCKIICRFSTTGKEISKVIFAEIR